MWAHPVNIERPEFGAFSHLCRGLFEDKRNFVAFFFGLKIEQFYRLSQLVGAEILKQNTNYRRAITSEERLANFLRYALKKSVGDKKGIADTIGANLFLD